MKIRLMAIVVGMFISISSAVIPVSAQVDTASAQVDMDSAPGDSGDPQQRSNGQAQQEPNAPADAPAAQADGSQEKEGSVGRISLLHGDLSTQRGDSGDWSAAVLNQPVVAGDRVATNQNSRAEVQLDYANILRIDSGTQANLTALTQKQIQVQLGHGLANYSVLKDSEADVEIDAPNLSVHPRRGDGSFRILVTADDQTEVTVRRGEADVSTPQGSRLVRSGQTIIVRGTGNDTQYQIADAASRDDFDRWNNDRDNTVRNAQSWNKTNRYYVGSEDLDSHGRWQSVPDYGDVWVPAVASDWAPYRDGRWVWEPYWGWTWVSNESWGWAPYHYGRWFLYDSSWVWWPGQSYGYRDYRPIWAPAYVSFYGFGGGVGFGFGFGGGFGSVGWLPIGPCDGFYPWWGGYRSRFNVVNIYNVHNVYNYRNGAIPPLRGGYRYSNLRMATENGRVRQAISTVDARDFGRGRIAPRPVSQEVFRNGRMVAGNLPVVPTRASLLAGERRAAPPTVGRGGQSQHFFSTNHSAPVRTQSFDREAASVNNAIRRDGHFTPIVGNSDQRSVAGENNARSFSQGRVAGENPGMGKPSAGVRKNGSGQGLNQRSNQTSDQSWRRMGGATQQPNNGAGPVSSNAGSRPERGGSSNDWRRSPNTVAPQHSTGNGTFNNGNPSGRPTPAPQGNGNQDWRRSDRPSGSVTPRQNSSPVQNGGNDWRRMPTQAPTSQAPVNRSYGNSGNGSTDRYSPRNSAPPTSRVYGNSGSRPQLDMRQPIVTPRYSSPSYSGGYRGNGGGYSAPRSAPSGGYSAPRSAPSGGYSAPRSAPSGGGYGGGHSAPSGGGGHSAPSGGEHSSGGNNGLHHGR